MAGDLPPEPPRDRFTTGHAMEHALAWLWRHDHPGWQLSPGEVQVRPTRFGFPVVITLDRRARRGASRRVVQMKTALDLWEWGDPRLDGEAPVDVVVQVMAEMHFSGYTDTADLIVMGPRFEHRTYVIEYDDELGAHIERRCRDWHRSLEAGEPPPLDDTTACLEAVRQLNPDIQDWPAQLPPELAIEWLTAARAVKANQAELTGLKSRVLTAMGAAKVAVVGDRRVGSRRFSGKSIALYPNLDIDIQDLRSFA